MMMPDHPIRLFGHDEDIRRVGAALLGCTLPKAEWTHEAHIAACAWLILERPDIKPERDLPALIRRYNESVGGVNSDTEGYHETITQGSIIGVRAALARADCGSLVDRVNAVLRSPEGRRDWLLAHYSPAHLGSVAARRSFVPPDLAPFPASPGSC
jgi:hypothetical protein